MKNILFNIIFLLFTATSCKHAVEEAPIIPLEDFFRNPDKTNFQISPNGRFYAYLAPWKNRLNLFVKEIDGDTSKQITHSIERGIAGYIWANDFRLLYAKDEGGNENYKLYAIDIDGSDKLCLTCFDNTKAQLIDGLDEFPEEVIIGLNLRDSTVFDPYRLNINTGDLEQLAVNPGSVIRWLTDHNGKLRCALATKDGVNNAVLYRNNENDPFKVILTTTWKDDFIPEFFTPDNNKLYAISNVGRDKKEAVVFDPVSKTETQVLFKHKDVDIDGLLYTKHQNKLMAASYITDRHHLHFFDQEHRKLYKKVASQLEDYEIKIVSVDKDESVGIIKTYSDKSRGKYYLVETATGKIIQIAEVSPWLPEEHLNTMEPITYRSRDGETIINGYLTLPKGKIAENLPTVIVPHGGPWARDYWGFQPSVQFLANRGYSVLQMNFRGSTGYGKEFMLKSVKQWGKAMQDDISDGVAWLTEKGIADKNRIAIYGASFGGYATLAGLTFTPELYACGIDYVGVSNLFTFLNSLPPYWEPMREQMYQLIGHPVKDSIYLAEVSPLLHVENIRAPLFIAQGTNDVRVKKQESDQMVEALRKSGIEVEYMVKDNEGHGFRNEENRLEFYRRIEIFLQKHIGD